MRVAWLLAAGCAAEPSDALTPPVDSALPADAVRFTFDLGAIELQLDREAAPETVANLLRYVDAGFFDGADGLGETVVHRVVPGFVIQGGGFTRALEPKEVGPPVAYEGDNGLSNLRGTIAMARTDRPDTATSQWFINLADNLALDHADGRPGYTVFGALTAGAEVVEAIAASPTSSRAGLDDVPDDPPALQRVERGP